MTDDPPAKNARPRAAEADIVERLRAYSMGDFDTYAVLRHRGEWIAQVTMIREASDLVEVLRDAAAEIERLRAAQAWRPIETAPRDATVVLGYQGDFGIMLVFWDDDLWWATDSDGLTPAPDVEIVDPTHWQPLPEPPPE